MHMAITGQCFVKWVTGMCVICVVTWERGGARVPARGSWGARIQRMSSNGFQQLLQRVDVWKTLRIHFKTCTKCSGAYLAKSSTAVA